QIPRLRLGIGRPADGRAVVDYVLTPVEEAQREIFQQGVNRAAEAALAFVDHSLEYVMNHYNSG
ncbi:MAG TPA: aminoacyl-tRNA hydrolase, partial [Bacillota bacterium]|nr:aminoacyl-tRNA hydrolase [Bacillota bacterium]